MLCERSSPYYNQIASGFIRCQPAHVRFQVLPYGVTPAQMGADRRCQNVPVFGLLAQPLLHEHGGARAA